MAAVVFSRDPVKDCDLSIRQNNVDSFAHCEAVSLCDLDQYCTQIRGHVKLAGSPLRDGESIITRGSASRGLSIQALARALRVPATRIHAIVNGHRGITGDTSARLGRYFGASPDFWLKLQVSYDIRCLDADKIEREVLPEAS